MNHTATYSPEDNKIRIYPGHRLDDELGDRYAAFKAAGYKWAAKQECFVCPRWTPQAEDWALELCGEIGDEDYSAVERSADRAERFEGYRDKRRGEAHASADTFDAGPAAFGHQSRARAERQARRHDRHRSTALSQWSKAEYWQQRTMGVISHALHKSSPTVRRGRILTLEADQRRHEKSLAECTARYEKWRQVAECPYPTIATKAAMALANASICWIECAHPRTGRRSSLYSLLSDPVDPITGAEAAALYLAAVSDPQREGSYSARWSAHYNLRLEYERAMLENEGGTAAAVEMEPGGWILPGRRESWRFRGGDGSTWMQVQKVNKSPATGRVTSVAVLALTSNDYDRKGKAYGPDNPRPLVSVNLNVERLGEDAYRPPTDAERAAFKQHKAATKPAPVPLINPTDGDAERLQAYLNARAAESARDANRRAADPRTVERITQARYSRFSGPDSIYSTCQFSIGGREFKVRCRARGFTEYLAARTVLVLSDKPQKPLPIDWAAVELPAPVIEPAATAPAAAGMLF